jgi:xanthine dehydrogenase YagS FAD-binding subunit
VRLPLRLQSINHPQIPACRSTAAVALDQQNRTVRDVRIALGGVSTAPWRAREAEAVLRGKVIDEGGVAAAADAAFVGAKG